MKKSHTAHQLRRLSPGSSRKLSPGGRRRMVANDVHEPTLVFKEKSEQSFKIYKEPPKVNKIFLARMDG